MKSRITRSSTDRMLAGLCGGLGEYFGIDSTWIRLGFIFLTPFTYFLTVLVYIICVFSFPEKRNIQETVFRRKHRRNDKTKKYY
ncbi:PspC domain-containing protein [Companilactobacillus crustorum]|uniref:PspC domain-containing protein n=1 Tax=Companilactobacillus crustorum TaxID=392416 RepID=UPI00237D615C|nr:PspC domain-containing protein [Companilactobacillus crustorum]WDT64856.1 PspC domain-containing protein [Companilactobacillus crustorum]